MNNDILYYAVYQENTLGYLFIDSCGKPALGILHASVLKGSNYNWLSGPISVDMDHVRKATANDLEEYLVCLPPDFVAPATDNQ